ncbi:cupin domain-containing protein [Sphingomonas flavalba]|uniref:cupin domain-containing protein n=1 Tax=Sphingomonas flavalba TaxID=2559804 RepID=UPI00109DBA47|nr:cupin domain-containing protein [Sphingomonas flavalba]
MNHSAGDTVHCADLPWLPLADGVRMKVIKADAETGRFSVIIRAEKDAVLPRHRHVERAEIYVIAGHGAHPQTGAYRAGDYISERRGAVHDALRFPVDTELLMICEGPSDFLGEDDTPFHRMDAQFLLAMASAPPAA